MWLPPAGGQTLRQESSARYLNFTHLETRRMLFYSVLFLIVALSSIEGLLSPSCVRFNRFSTALADRFQLEQEFEKQTLKERLYLLAARTERGLSATSEEKALASNVISNIENLNLNLFPAREATGRWELIYTNTQPFRSSPLFLSARSLLKDGDQANAFDSICSFGFQAIKFARVGRVFQIITPTSLTSEFEVEVPLLPGLPASVIGTISSIADIVDTEDNIWTLDLDRIRVKEGSTNIPLIGAFLDTFSGIPIKAAGKILESNVPSLYTSPKPVLKTFFMDEEIRISRDQDDNIFVYTKIEQDN